MLVWQGWGILAALLPVVFILLMELLVSSPLGSTFPDARNWSTPLGFVLSAIPIFILGHKLNNKPGRIVVDQETQEVIELKKKHTFFWLPLQYWSFAIIAMSAWMYYEGVWMI